MFQFLDYHDRATVACTCRDWNGIAIDPASAWGMDINLTSFHIPYDTWMIKGLRDVRLRGHVNDEVRVIELLNNSTKLHTLRTSLKSLSYHRTVFPQLRTLHVHDTNLEDPTTTHCVEAEGLEMFVADHINFIALTAVLASFKRLKTLMIISLDFQDKDAKLMLSYLPESLTAISLTSSGYYNSRVLPNIRSTVTELIVLTHMMYDPQMPDLPTIRCIRFVSNYPLRRTDITVRIVIGKCPNVGKVMLCHRNITTVLETFDPSLQGETDG